MGPGSRPGRHGVFCTKHTFTISRRDAPEVCTKAVPRNEREQEMPGARCTRGLVCKVHKGKRTRAYRYSRSIPAFPAQWLYGLCRALPGDEFVLSPSLADQGWSSSVELTSPPRNLAPATGVETTRFCRTLWRRSSCALVDRSRETRPATPLRADAAASTASPPAFVTTRDRPSCRERMGRAGSADLPDRLSGILPVALICRSHGASGWAKALGPCPNRTPAISEMAPRPEMPERCETRRD
jgi:hypothetical protein